MYVCYLYVCIYVCYYLSVMYVCKDMYLINGNLCLQLRIHRGCLVPYIHLFMFTCLHTLVVRFLMIGLSWRKLYHRGLRRVSIYTFTYIHIYICTYIHTVHTNISKYSTLIESVPYWNSTYLSIHTYI